MNNIPTDLLRTLITVVEQRSFTRAAQALGLTQPAVSAHIKRLQAILGSDLFDRSGPGLRLTPKGELIVEHARRLLSINDLILHVAAPTANARMIRLGVPVDFLGDHLPHFLKSFRRRWPDLRFSVHHGGLDAQLSELRGGQLDLTIGLSLTEPAGDARCHWAEKTYWVRGPLTKLSPNGPVPLVSFREDCVYHRVAVSALKKVGRDSEAVFLGPTIVTLAAAVSAGLGIMALPRSRAWPPQLMLWEDAPLPDLPDLYWGVYLRESGGQGPLEEIANSIAAEMRARSAAAAQSTETKTARSMAVFARRAVS